MTYHGHAANHMIRFPRPSPSAFAYNEARITWITTNGRKKRNSYGNYMLNALPVLEDSVWMCLYECDVTGSAGLLTSIDRDTAPVLVQSLQDINIWVSRGHIR